MGTEKVHKIEYNLLFNKKVRNCVYYFTYILPDFMAHDMFKEF